MTHRLMSLPLVWPLVLITVAVNGHFARGAEWIVEDGQANAEIVVAEQPPRTTMLAAEELQRYIEKISGANLAIVTAPSDDVPVQVYVGRSRHAASLGVTDDGLKYGAYQIKSGDNWLALIGRDQDFTPIEPWVAYRNSQHRQAKMHEWDRLTDARWGQPMRHMYKRFSAHASRYDPDEPVAVGANPDKPIELWQYDARGSFNAVCAFLRGLGVRWYMPGEIGEVVPEMRDIPLPEADKTVHPDFVMRRFNNNFRVEPREVHLWMMRLGTRKTYEVWGVHGMATITGRDELKHLHPEYYALYAGKRATGRNHVCFSSYGLYRSTIEFLRTMYDHYKLEEVSIMPNDAFTAMCQCQYCEGADTPDRGFDGRLSDYVWNFANRVAGEVARSHPDKKVINYAYNTYRQPPRGIDKLQSNIRVAIVNGRQPRTTDPVQRERMRALRQAWREKTDNRLYMFENYLFTHNGEYRPAYALNTIVESINNVRGHVRGEDIWLSLVGYLRQPGMNHALIYFTARSWWGGQRDAQEMIDEYCRLFYGPAADRMKAFFTYCEKHFAHMSKDKEKVDRALELFADAKMEADVDTVYGKRIALIDEYLDRLRDRREQLVKEQERGDVPELQLARRASDVKIDGKLDDRVWTQKAGWGKGRLREVITGRKAALQTNFRVAWERGNLYLGIRCEETSPDTLKIGTTADEDPAIWYGDNVEILIETDKSSYYQIAINPAGAIVDLHRRGGANGKRVYRWDSQAEVATHIGEDDWTVEVRIPVVNQTDDPLHQVVGGRPQESMPWYFNVCRQRVRGEHRSLSAFAPTGKRSFHVPHKFAKLYR